MNKLPYLSSRLAKLRKERGISLYRLAKMTGMTNQGVCNLESGVSRNPSWETVQLLATAFDVPTDHFRQP